MGYGAGAAKVMEEFANAPMWQRLAGAVMPGLAERHVAQQYPQFRQALEQQRAARMANMYYRPGQGYR